jgi:hypothetical protein
MAERNKNMKEEFDCSKLTEGEIRKKAKDMNIIFDAAQKERLKEKELKRNFEHNVDVLVERFKDDVEGLEEMMESLQKNIDSGLETSESSESPRTQKKEREQAIYEMETCVQALAKIRGEQE